MAEMEKWTVPEMLELKELTCGIPYAAIGQLIGQIDKSLEEKREHSTTFCAKEGEGLSLLPVAGEPDRVQPRKCKEDEFKVGTFHTHPPGDPERSALDWFYTIIQGDDVSCIGSVYFDEVENKPLKLHAMDCYRINKSHPEYNEFIPRFVSTLKDLVKWEDDMIKKLESEGRPANEQEYAESEKHYEKMESMVKEAEMKGVFNRCTPTCVESACYLPDVNEMLKGDLNGTD